MLKDATRTEVNWYTGLITRCVGGEKVIIGAAYSPVTEKGEGVKKNVRLLIDLSSGD